MTNDAATAGNGSERRAGAECAGQGRRSRTDKPAQPETRTFPAGTYVLRMDQPYSRIADTLLDYQYLGARRSAAESVRRHRLDLRRAVQRQGRARHRREGARRAARARQGRADGCRQRHAARAASSPSTTTPTRRSRRCAIASRTRRFDVAEEPFEADGPEVQPRVVHHPRRRHRRRSRQGRGRPRPQGRRARRRAHGEDAPRQGARASRCSTPGSTRRTKAGGAWRSIRSPIPYDYISTQDVAKDADLESQVRRDPLSAGRPRRRAADHHRPADVRQSAAVEDDAS